MDEPSSDASRSAHEAFMRAALDEARTASAAGEVPVGAVVVLNQQIIARGSNRSITACDPTAHAEIVALRQAALELGNYRLPAATVYTTIEPCAMCAGALVWARVERLVYGAPDPRAGAVHSIFEICTSEQLNHRVTVVAGVLEDECRELIQGFFRERRRAPAKADSEG
jgi:tRNA(adenine34) deaminase